MAEISASLVKALREQSGAGMMDCKKALQETDGDMEAAADWLRKKGLSQAQKKSARVAAEGLIGVATEESAAAVVEVNAETDFVARNEQFQEFVNAVMKLALSVDGDTDALLAAEYPGTGRTVEDELTQRIAMIGENIILRRSAYLSVSPGVVGAYIHNAVTEGLGKIGVIVALESEGDPQKLQALAKQMAMHIAAAGPQAVDIDSLDPEAVARERDILASQARESGKPENIIEKMVEGRLRKFYEEFVLLSQIWVIDGESRVEDVLEQAAEDVGAPVKVKGFHRFEIGEMAEKPEEEEDFAAEVAKAAGH